MIRTIHSFLALSLFLFASPSGAEISKYEVASEICNGGELFALRRFHQEGREEQVLTVNTRTLKTKLVQASDLTGCVSQGAVPFSTAYGQALERYNSSSERLSACQGFKNFPTDCTAPTPMVLTADLCPSSKSLEQWTRDVEPFLLKIASLKHGASAEPAHLVLAVTGAWLRSHARELAIIKSLDLDVTWANHSDTHGLLPTRQRPEQRAFLTQTTRSQFRAEVLGAEKAMLERGLTPSIFFRFPGLYSRSEQIDELKALGLIPLNSTAWLAIDGSLPPFFRSCGMSEDQAARAGRVILTHANDNEPLGIQKAMTVLARQRGGENLISIEQAVRCDLSRQYQ